jgi:chromosome segregation ATPase
MLQNTLKMVEDYEDKIDNLTKQNKKLKRNVSKLQNKLSVVINEKEEKEILIKKLDEVIDKAERQLYMNHNTMREQANIIYNYQSQIKYLKDSLAKSEEVINLLDSKIKSMSEIIK